MNRAAIAAIACAALLGLAPAAPAAEAPATTRPVTTVRVGDHPGYSRIVFDLPPDAGVHMVGEGERVLLVFTGAGVVVPPGDLPRNLGAIRTGTDTATLDLRPGATARSARIGDRLVVDILDPAGRPSARQAALPTPKPPVGKPSSRPVTEPPSTPPEAPTPVAERAEKPAATHPPDEPAASPVEPVAKQAFPPPLPASVQPASQPSPALVIKADSDVAAAAFRRGDVGVVVLDRRLSDQKLSSDITWANGAVSTVLQIPLSPDTTLRLSRTGPGWQIDREPASKALPATPAASETPNQLPVGRPGRRVTILDPVSGSTLLVGASLDGTGAVAVARRMPGYRLLPSWLGIVVEPSSDQVDLRPGEGAFLLTGDTLPPAAAASPSSRRFDLPNEPPAELLNRLRAQLASAADAPPRARSRDRTAAVQSMLALGLGAEAQSLAQAIAADDPQAAADAQTGALAAMAAILAGRPGEAGTLDDPRLDGTDEIALWRGLRDRRLGTASPAAARIGALAPLVLSYPATLQRLIWSDVAEAAVEAGGTIPPDHLPPYARAMSIERGGAIDEALAAYDQIAAGPDRLDQVRATARAAEIRLAAGRITPAEASAVMERQSIAWRGDARELGFRLRAAELQAAARQWRPALDALRAIEASMPEQKALIQPRKAAVMQAMLDAEGAGMSALDLVTLAADYTDCAPQGPAGASLARLLAAKLAALDLPARAIPVLQGLLQTTAPGPSRAEFGARLAQLLFEGGDMAGAAASLDASRIPGLPPALGEERDLLSARLRAATGEPQEAAALLARLGTERADDLRATLLASAGDWSGSLRALRDLAARTVPPEGTLSDSAQSVLLREADAAARLGDTTLLRELRPALARLSGPRADVFRLLTAPPLEQFADLPRARLELAAARGLPRRLEESAAR